MELKQKYMFKHFLHIFMYFKVFLCILFINCLKNEHPLRKTLAHLYKRVIH